MPTPIIPPIAPDVTKIKSLIKVEEPGADLKAAIPMRVSNIKSKNPHIAPIISPFFPSFLAVESPPKNEPTAIAMEDTIPAELVGSILKDIISANKTNRHNVTVIPKTVPVKIAFSQTS